MSDLPSSQEVAADFKDSLEDLQINNRYEISNLTIIAKENTEHAHAISQVLENHINTVAPARKLPALYVLDSIVKNVSSPYRVFLSKNLYKTFMHAYTLVDPGTRKAMEAMLKTWKENASFENRPVIPVEVTRSIENALIQARTAAIQQQQPRGQRPMFPQQPGALHPGMNNNRPTPTPPPPLPYASLQAMGIHQQSTSQDQLSLQQILGQLPNSNTPVQHLAQSQNSGGGLDVQRLLGDLETLLNTAKMDFARNMQDSNVQQRLMALLDLQKILQTQQLAPHELNAIQEQVARLSQQNLHSHQSSSGAMTGNMPPVANVPAARTFSPRPEANMPQPPAGNVPPAIDTNMLSALLGAVKANQPTAAPVSQVANLAPAAMPLASQAGTLIGSGTGSLNASSLVDSLIAAGLMKPTLPATPNNVVAASILSPRMNAAPLASSNLAGVAKFAAPIPHDVELTSASLKIPRSHLISRLYDARPDQCKSCGRRFNPDELGRQQKAKHYDWHFRVNQRLADAAKTGQSRTFLVDEFEWIKMREFDISIGETSDVTGKGDAGKENEKNSPSAANGAKTRYVAVPSDPQLANSGCPICQEKFQAVWNDDAQDFVWMDAIRIGNRIFHASCHAEVHGHTRNLSANPPARNTPTPDSVLGKRKYEAGTDNQSGKLAHR